MATALHLENFSYAWPGAERWVLREIDLRLAPGECHCLGGGTGCGKTTLALALKGLLPEGRQSGRLTLPAPPGEARAGVGLVLQNPETQLLTDTVGAEVAFGLENLCLPPERMPDRVQRALAAAGLELPLDHPTERLSMGQKYRLLVAAQLVMEPALLVLDEPAGQLDPAGLHSLVEVIRRLKDDGVAVLLCEHAPEPLAPVIDRHWRLTANGGLGPGRPPAPARPAPARLPRRPLPSAAAPLLEARGLSVDPQDATPAWSDLFLTLGPGERAVLSAPNGSGKTTLLRCLAGFLRPWHGEVRVFGAPPEPARLRGRLGYLLQNPARQLFETTVSDEVAFSLWRAGVSRAAAAEAATRILERCGIDELARSSPHLLSYGQRHLVALAAILAPAPQLLLLDDPFAGLDAWHAAQVVEVLVALSEERGTALLCAVHDEQPRPDWAHRTLGIEGGHLVPR